MTNTTSCFNVFGDQYCESEDKSGSTSLMLAVIAVLAVVLISVALASNASLFGTVMLDGSYFGY